jgi:hypothetical protein
MIVIITIIVIIISVINMYSKKNEEEVVQLKNKNEILYFPFFHCIYFYIYLKLEI